MKNLSQFLFVIIFILFLNRNVESSIFPIINNGVFDQYSSATSFVYSNKSSVPHTSPGDGKPYAGMNGYITINSEAFIPPNSDDNNSNSNNNNNNNNNSNGNSNEPYINFLLYRMNEVKYIGDVSGTVCCTLELSKSKQCEYGTVFIQDSTYTTDDTNKNYTLIINHKTSTGDGGSDNTDGSHVYGITIVPKLQSFPISITIPIDQTGLYSLIVTTCKPASTNIDSPFTVDADLIFMNPYGYLTGDKYPFLYFNLILSAFYVGLFIMWAVLFLKFKDTALRIQYWISLVILLGFLESLTNYFTLSSINKIGHFSNAGVFFVTLFGTLKSGFARSLVVLVSLGYGVMVPRLPKPTIIKLSVITVVYLLIKGAQNYVYNSPTQTNSTQISFIYLTLPVSVLDTVFYWWILTSLTEIMNNLQTKNQTAKLLMFRSFIWVLLGSAVCSFIILMAEIIVTWATSYEYSAQTSWVVEVSWGVSYFVVLVSICWIWKPNANNQKFAYSELADQDDDIGLESIDGLSHRGHKNNTNNNNGTRHDIIDNENTIESIDGQANTFTIQDEYEDQDLHDEKVEIADMFKNL
ncbi:seven transmembrane domain protein [Dictyostelium discoideum AX4]|uniref:Seven transmembrane domain protein n=1 Tax=Dictyostelium discoideum TaxID=44689 RepID=B0G155_DICDI|nr:seven transmembrane domain protein [Dictyostelium discoideum AX4]EDR41053.1 seven transmembrane domain protein [Dictyostelium discoideum AX4]|eukprot:XP_001733018.1 seven transmembrane domain protein [Dictyostelium discoideum AX4]